MNSRAAVGNKIVEIALTFSGSAVYGGWVRDSYVRTEDFNDIDISFVTLIDKAQFVKLLKVLYVTKIVSDVYGSGEILCGPGNKARTIISVMVDGNALNVDCGVANCGEIVQTDFTCNALVLTNFGLNSFGKGSFMKCMAHVKQKKFSITRHCHQSYANLYCSRIITRAIKLINDGWTMIPTEKSFCISIFPPKEVCSICLSVIFPDMAIQTACGHHFHVECMTSYLLNKSSCNSVNCPNCRFGKFLI